MCLLKHQGLDLTHFVYVADGDDESVRAVVLCSCNLNKMFAYQRNKITNVHSETNSGLSRDDPTSEGTKVLSLSTVMPTMPMIFVPTTNACVILFLCLAYVFIMCVMNLSLVYF